LSAWRLRDLRRWRLRQRSAWVSAWAWAFKSVGHSSAASACPGCKSQVSSLALKLRRSQPSPLRRERDRRESRSREPLMLAAVPSWTRSGWGSSEWSSSRRARISSLSLEFVVSFSAQAPDEEVAPHRRLWRVPGVDYSEFKFFGELALDPHAAHLRCRDSGRSPCTGPLRPRPLRCQLFIGLKSLLPPKKKETLWNPQRTPAQTRRRLRADQATGAGAARVLVVGGSPWRWKRRGRSSPPVPRPTHRHVPPLAQKKSDQAAMLRCLPCCGVLPCLACLCRSVSRSRV
jgi:hypothetical protein